MGGNPRELAQYGLSKRGAAPYYAFAAVGRRKGVIQ